MEPKRSLEKRLGDILGFDDAGLTDILDHLLSIESDEDLRDYLSQLLGSEDEESREFIKDLGRFQKGEPYEFVEPAATASNSQQQPPPPPAVVAAAPAKKPTATTKAQKKEEPETNKKKEPATGSSAGAKDGDSSSSSQDVPKESSQTDSNPDAAATAERKKTPPPRKKYALPPKGQAKRKCGCFGTLHKPLTNCLYCGRISCAEEGYDFCPFCGYLVEQVKAPEGDSNSAEARAWQHKERLLRYDRESAKRTVVLDDQADYYTNQSSQWLTEDEQAEAEDKDHDQRSNMHNRKKQTLNIAF